MPVGVCFNYCEVAHVLWEGGLDSLQIAFKSGEVYLRPAAQRGRCVFPRNGQFELNLSLRSVSSRRPFLKGVDSRAVEIDVVGNLKKTIGVADSI